MKIKTVQILWHNKEAIFSADFEPHGNRLATGGADQTVRVCHVHLGPLNIFKLTPRWNVKDLEDRQR